MIVGRVGLVQEAQRNPAREKLGFGVRDAGVLAKIVTGGDLIGLLRVPGIQRFARLIVMFVPPFFDVGRLAVLGLRGADEEWARFVIAIVFTQPMGAVEQEAGIVLQV